MKGSIERFEHFLTLIECGNYTKEQICEVLGIDVRTFYRYVGRVKRIKNLDVIYKEDKKVCVDNISRKDNMLSKDLKLLINLSVDAAESYIDFFINSPELIRAYFDLKFGDKYIEIHKQPKCKLSNEQKYFLTKLYTNLMENKEYLIYDIKYHPPNGEYKEYTIVPYKIVFKRRAWYILALDCTDDYNIKLFRANRIIELKMKNEYLDYDIYKGKAKDIFKNAWEFYGGEELKKVKLKIDKEEIWTYLTEVIWHQSQVNDYKNKIIEFLVAEPREMLPFILQYADGIEILEPIELKHEYIKVLRNAINKNSDT